MTESISNFTPRAQQVLVLARREASQLNHNFVGTEHLLLGIIALGQGTAVKALGGLGLDLQSVREEVQKHVATGPDQKIIGNIPYTPRVKKVLALAAKEAKTLNHTYVGTEHLLLGLLQEADGVGARVLRHFHVEVDATRNSILAELDPSYRAGSTPGGPSAASSSTSPARPGNMISAPVPNEPLDTTKRYDITCTDWSQGVTICRNARFKSVKNLFQRSQYDALSAFFEIELEDGRSIFVSRSSVIRFEEHTPGAAN